MSDNQGHSSEAGIINRMSPMALFEEYTFLTDEQRTAIIGRCFSVPATIPIIEYSDRHSSFLFHTLFQAGFAYKKGCSKLFGKPVKNTWTELDFEDEFCGMLDDRAIKYQRQLYCSAGVADVVSNTFVVELKRIPGSSGWQRAIGQAVSYRSALCRENAAILSFQPVPSWVAKACRSVGILYYAANTITKLVDAMSE